MNFKNVPNNTKIPLFHAEISNRAANIFSNSGRALIIGLATADSETPFFATDEATVIANCGRGSMCHRDYLKFRANNTSTELWILPVNQNSAGVAATGKLTLAGTATADGILQLYINATRVQVPVASGDTASSIATAAATLINANTMLPCTASASGGEITLTATAKGAWGNGIMIEINMNGADAGEETPAGITPTITAFASGAGDPDLTEKIAVLGDREYDFIINPFCDTTNLNVIRDFMNDTVGRWSDDQQIYGHAWSILSGTASACQTFGNARNDQHNTIFGIQGARQLTDEILAAAVARIALAYINDPARPVTFAELSGVYMPTEANRWDKATRNTLLGNGISTFRFTESAFQIERIVTTYQRNSAGEADVSYRETNTMYTLQYIVRKLRSAITSKYPDYKLADDGYAGTDNAVVTPGILKAEILAQYHDMCINSPVVCENEELFAQALVVERDTSDVNRVNAYIAPDLVNQLLIFAALVEFRLNF